MSSSSRHIGLALAGGGPLGAGYEIGALAALQDCLIGVDLTELDVYVGVSSGALLAAGLANGVRPTQLARMFVEGDAGGERFDPALLLKPAYREYLHRAMAVPPLLLASLWRYLADDEDSSLLGAVQHMGRAIPNGIFDGRAIDRYLAGLFDRPGRTNDFRKLRHRLYLVATDLDSGRVVEFGAPGHDDIPISLAVQASTALPGLFPPVRIAGRHYVDGVLKKTLHASVALRHGARLVLCINPLVPYDADPHAQDGERGARLAEAGLPLVLSQTFRSIIHSRMQVGMERYRGEYPGADVVLFEPNRHDRQMFFTNIFSYASRRRLAEHAYQKTREELRKRREELEPILARHGIELDLDGMTQPDRHLVDVRRTRRGAAASAQRLSNTLDDLERWLRVTARQG
jgi:predicted acylesterase/phospholipase RssA